MVEKIYNRYDGIIVEYIHLKDNCYISKNSGIAIDLDKVGFSGKTSKNIIDLIEYGDLIKFKTVKVTDMRDGKEREFNFIDAKFCDGWTDNKMIYDMDYLIDKDQTSQIEWVLTHEQIYREKYEV